MKSEHLTEVKQILKQHQFKKLFSGDTENTFIQFFRYCFVGGFATVVDWALSSLLFYLAFSGSGYAALCNGLSFVAGLLVNYFLSTFWIFKQSKMQNRFLEFLSFAAIGVVGLLLTIGSLGVGRCDKLVSDFEQGSFHSSGILLELLRKKVPAVYQERSIKIYIFQN